MKRLETALLYGILDTGYVADDALPDMARRLIAGGIDLLQLRAKGRDEEDIQRLGEAIIAITEPAGVPLIVNDHPELVPAIGAQGAHVGQDDLAVDNARWRAGRALAGEVPAPIIGKSTHGIVQALAAQEEGADYIGFGPLFPTPTKAGRPAIGLDDVERLYELIRIPIFCIGGIKRDNLERVIAAGARRVVIVSGLLQARDIESYARDCHALLAAANA
jgi:thiamine-phosphate pyrophosphorylase